jgi:folate-binding protein YgfZ
LGPTNACAHAQGLLFYDGGMAETAKTDTALTELLDECGAQWMNYGPAPSEGGVAVVESFGAYEAAYAAIRQRVGIVHMPQRGRIEITGEERADFLHRMISANVRDLEPGQGRPGFMLNEKGRIVADLVVLQEADRAVVELDRFDVDGLMELWDSRLFAEDVQLTDQTEQTEILTLHGPAALTLLAEASGERELSLQPMAHQRVRIGQTVCLVYRRDDAGTPGLHLHVPMDAAAAVYRQLLARAGFDPRAELDADFAEHRRQSLRGRPAGWLAYNSARIEAGTPIFHIDFGPDSLAHETGIVHQQCDFEKGCYLGQEIVARMESLGHPKRILTGLKLQGEAMPVAGAQLFSPDETGTAPSEQVVGAVTSSTVSPMLGGQAIGFAVVKWGWQEPGTAVYVNCEGQTLKAQTHALRFLS